jgi:hypothetical protein
MSNGSLMMFLLPVLCSICFVLLVVYADSDDENDDCGSDHHRSVERSPLAGGIGTEMHATGKPYHDYQAAGM